MRRIFHLPAESLYYDANRLSGTYAPDGGITLLTYDATYPNKIATQRTLQTSTGGVQVWLTHKYQYDKDGRIATETLASGLTLQNIYDIHGNLLSTKTTGVDGITSTTVSATYDLSNRRVSSTDAGGNTSIYRYDNFGNLIAQTDARNNVTHYYYDIAGNRIGQLDPLGNYTAWTYDLFGNVLSETQYATPYHGAILDLTPPVIVSSNLDRIQRNAYDAENKVIVTTAADGSVTTFQRDVRGNVLVQTQYPAANATASATPVAPRVTSYTYDGAGNTLTSTDWTGKKTTSVYDADGNLSKQTVTYEGFPAEIEVTTYLYDGCNRQISVTRDPDGLKNVQSIVYDMAGNITAHIDADGNRYSYTFDGYNRASSEIDATGQISHSYAYDALNRVISAVSSTGVVSFTFDANGKKLTETRATAWQSINATGNSNTLHYQYDANGNVVLTTYANGSKDTRYYDADNRLIEEVNADGVVHTYQYDAFGDQVSSTLYMTQLPTAPSDLATPPQPPVGATHVITTAYDVNGRVVSVTYPAIQVTKLDTSDLQNPSTTTVTEALVATNVYDGWGDVLETTDSKGQTTYAYYNAQGQVAASVNAAGYLTAYSYNGAGQVLQQTVYYQNTVDVSSLSLTQIPQGSGPTAVSNYAYDSTGRLSSQTGPLRTVTDPDGSQVSARPVTQYKYDAQGNIIAVTSGAGTSLAQTVYSYYDADNRLQATISAGRTLTLYTYDAYGNKTSEQNFANAVSPNVDLSKTAGYASAQLYALVEPSTADQATVFIYDTSFRLISQQTVLNGSGATGTAVFTQPSLSAGQTAVGGIVRNVDGSLTEVRMPDGSLRAGFYGPVAVQNFAYDNFGNRTWQQDANGNAETSQYDNDAHLIRTNNSNGSSTVAQYDAAGNQVSVYMGSITNQAVVAGNISASQGAALNFNWTVAGMSGGTTWVVWSTSSHSAPSDYANTVGQQAATNAGHSASINNPAAGSTLYFRVVTQDVGGNLAWSAEQTVTVLPQNDSIDVQPAANGTLLVTAHFNGNVSNPQLNWGTSGINGSLPNAITLTSIGNGLYQGILPASANNSALVYGASWTANGSNYTGGVQQLASTNPHVGVVSNLQSQWLNGTNNADGYSISLNATVATTSPIGTNSASSNATTFSGISALVQAADGSRVIEVDAEALVVNGVETYHLLLGNEQHQIAAGTYTITLYGTPSDGNKAYVIDHFTYTVDTLSSSAPSATTTLDHVTWVNPQSAIDSAWLVVDGKIQSTANGQNLPVGSSTQFNGSTIYNAAALNSGDNAASIAYGQGVGTTHSSSIGSTQATQLVTHVTPTGNYNFDATVSASSLPGSIVAASGLYLQYTSGSGNQTVPMALASGVYDGSITGAAPTAGSYVIYGLDSQGHQVVVTSGSYTPPGSGSPNGSGQIVNNQGVVSFVGVAQTVSSQVLEPIPNTYNLNFNFGFNPSEIANMVGGLQVQLTRYSDNSVTSVSMSGSGNAFTGSQQVKTDTSGIANQYEAKIWYTNTQGQTVIVGWIQYDPTTSWNVGGVQSSVIVAQELGDHVVNNGNTFYNGAGLKEGIQAVATHAYQLTLGQTGSPSGGKSASGLTSGYYVNSQFDAMGNQIAGNGADGIWHTYGVDLAGNRVADANWGLSGTAAFSGVDLSGTAWNQLPASMAGQSQLAPLSQTYTVFDHAGRTLASIGAQFQAVGAGGGTHAQRDVNLYQYNAYNEVTAQATLIANTNLNVFDQNTALGSAVGKHSFAEYDAAGEKIATIDAGYGSVSDASTEKAQFGYDIQGRQVQSIDENGYFTRQVYDSRGYVVQQVRELQRSSDNVATQVSATTFVYDGLGRQLLTIDADGNVTLSTYDQRNLVISESVVGRLADVNALPTTAAGLAALSSKPADLPGFTAISNPVTINTYDGNGNLTSKTTGTNKVSYAYDAFNHIVRTTTMQNGVAVVATQTYDVNGNLISQIDGAGHVTTYTYGAFGRLLSRTVGDASTSVWQPYANVYSGGDNGGLDFNTGDGNGSNGQMITIAGNQVVTSYSYNDLNQQVLQTNNLGQNISQAWDAAGHHLSTSDVAVGNTVNSFDGYGQEVRSDFVSTVATPGGDSAQVRDMSYTYDAFGRQTSVSDSGTGLSTSYNYDHHGNLIGVSSSKGGGNLNANVGAVNPTNDNAGVGSVSGEINNGAPVEGSNMPNLAFNHVYVFDGNNKIVQMSDAVTGQLVATYSYDAVGNLASENQVITGTRTQYTYDSQNRLVASIMVGGSVEQEYATYGYAHDYQVGMVNMTGGVQSFTSSGSTLGQIAANLYGDANLWTYVQAANSSLAGYGKDTFVAAGQQLNAPNLWQTRISYDGNGNVAQQTSGFGGAIGTRTTNSYYENNTLSKTVTESTWVAKGSQISQNNQFVASGGEAHVDMAFAVTSINTYTLDGSGRTLSMQSQNFSNFSGGGNGQAATAGQQSVSHFTYSYNGTGQVTSIQGKGGSNSSGTSTITYNVNGQEISINQGQGDGMATAESSAYVYNTEGQIIYQQHVDGQAGDATETISYDYNTVTGGRMGETGVYADGQYHTYLDGGSYASMQQITPSAVGSGQSGYTASGGETLAQVAQAMYGNASLWYLIANANGLAQNSTLKAGEQISLPTSLPSGQSNATTTKLYNSSDIQGSNLPNLKAPPPSSGGCGGFGSILLIVVAIAVTIYTAGALAEVATGVSAGAGTSAAAVGAEVGAAAGSSAAATGLSAVVATSSSTFAAGLSIVTGSAGLAGAAVAAGAAVIGSVVSQELGKSLGVVQHFSLKQALESGIAGGVGAGVGSLAQGASSLTRAGLAIAGNAVTQETSIQLGLQQRFNWAQLAASGIISAAASSPTGESLMSSLGKAVGTSVGNLADSIGDISKGLNASLQVGASTIAVGVVNAIATQEITNALASNSRDRRSLSSSDILSAGISSLAYGWNGVENAADTVSRASSQSSIYSLASREQLNIDTGVDRLNLQPATDYSLLPAGTTAPRFSVKSTPEFSISDEGMQSLADSLKGDAFPEYEQQASLLDDLVSKGKQAIQSGKVSLQKAVQDDIMMVVGAKRGVQKFVGDTFLNTSLFVADQANYTANVLTGGFYSQISDAPQQAIVRNTERAHAIYDLAQTGSTAVLNLATNAINDPVRVWNGFTDGTAGYVDSLKSLNTIDATQKFVDDSLKVGTAALPLIDFLRVGSVVGDYSLANTAGRNAISSTEGGTTSSLVTTPTKAAGQVESVSPPQFGRVGAEAADKIVQIPQSLTESDLGQVIGSGQFKDIRAINGRNDIVVALEREPTVDTPKYINQEIDALNRLDAMGIPTVKNFGVVDVNGNPGILMERVDGAVSSKTILENGDLSRISQLNAHSIEDLTTIRNGMIRNNAFPDDFQVLIGKNGRVVVNDPMGISHDIVQGSLDIIDNLIALARKNK